MSEKLYNKLKDAEEKEDTDQTVNTVNSTQNRLKRGKHTSVRNEQ